MDTIFLNSGPKKKILPETKGVLARALADVAFIWSLCGETIDSSPPLMCDLPHISQTSLSHTPHRALEWA